MIFSPSNESVTTEGATNTQDLVTESVPDAFGNMASQIVDPDEFNLTTTFAYDFNGN